MCNKCSPSSSFFPLLCGDYSKFTIDKERNLFYQRELAAEIEKENERIDWRFHCSMECSLECQSIPSESRSIGSSSSDVSGQCHFVLRFFSFDWSFDAIEPTSESIHSFISNFSRWMTLFPFSSSIDWILFPSSTLLINCSMDPPSSVHFPSLSNKSKELILPTDQRRSFTSNDDLRLSQ